MSRQARPSIEPRQFRRVMGHFATGVAVVTARERDGRASGLTVNALASVSLDPPLVLVCLDREAATHATVLASRAFAVNVLPDDGDDLARRFSRGRRATRFRGVDVRDEVTGSPVLERALAWADCRVEAVHPGGDHSIVVGRVVGLGTERGRPLVFFDGAMGGFAP